MPNTTYIKKSLEYNVFFLRILKEHSYFIAASFPGKYKDLIEEGIAFNTLFNNLLKKAVELSIGVIQIREDAVTNYTLLAEEKTAGLTGINIDTDLTKLELTSYKPTENIDTQLEERVNTLNQNIINATRSLIRYKTRVLDEMLKCNIFNFNYPLLIEHTREEAILYLDILNKLQLKNDEIKPVQEVMNKEAFWNDIMEEHSMFIRGLLDPSEQELITTANDFAIKYNDLNKNLGSNKTIFGLNHLTDATISLTEKLKDFKTTGTIGILECKIKSIILPLLADHVLREANHYLYLLNNFKDIKK